MLYSNGFYTLPSYADDEFRFNDASTRDGHLRQNGVLTWFCNETAIMISHHCLVIGNPFLCGCL